MPGYECWYSFWPWKRRKVNFEAIEWSQKTCKEKKETYMDILFRFYTCHVCKLPKSGKSRSEWMQVVLKKKTFFWYFFNSQFSGRHVVDGICPRNIWKMVSFFSFREKKPHSSRLMLVSKQTISAQKTGWLKDTSFILGHKSMTLYNKAMIVLFCSLHRHKCCMR